MRQGLDATVAGLLRAGALWVIAFTLIGGSSPGSKPPGYCRTSGRRWLSRWPGITGRFQPCGWGIAAGYVPSVPRR